MPLRIDLALALAAAIPGVTLIAQPKLLCVQTRLTQKRALLDTLDRRVAP